MYYDIFVWKGGCGQAIRLVCSIFMKDVSNETFIKKTSAKDISSLIFSAAAPALLFFLCMFTISQFKNYGRLLLTPIMGAMWAAGAVCVLILPSDKESIIHETEGFILALCLGDLLLQKAISIVSGVSADMLTETFSQPLPSTTGNILPGYLQYALWMFTIMIPISYLGLQGKRLINLRRASNKDRELRRIRGIGGQKDSKPY